MSDSPKTLSDLRMNKKNPRKISEDQLQALKSSLEKFGDLSGFVFNRRSQQIVGGHQRNKVLPAESEIEILESYDRPTSVGTVAVGRVRIGEELFSYREVDWDESTEKAANIAANKHGGEWDMPQLEEWLRDLNLSGFNLDVTGFDTKELNSLGVSLTTPDPEKDAIEDDVPEPTRSISKLGDIYELGEHRLMCGDSTSIDAVEKLMAGSKADMVFTDPPYGMDLDTDYSKLPSTKAEGNKTYKKVAGDADDFKPELIQTIFAAFADCPEIFIFGADYFAELLVNKNEGSWIVWDKRIEEKFDRMFGSAFELCWSKGKHKREIARFNNTLFGGDIESRGKVHPTQKPTKLIEWFFDKWGKPQDKVADLFGGSGSTLIACEKTKRKCFMMELDPHYVDVIVSRYVKYSGKTSIKRNGEPMEWTI